VGLATRLMGAQMIVILVGGITLLVALSLIAPGLFAMHLERTGEDTPGVQQHAQQAFTSSMAIALGLAGITAITAAGVLSWVLSRRVAQPISELSTAAEQVAAGRYDVTVADPGFSRELATLAASFQDMADRLERTDTARAQLLADLAHEIRTPLATLAAHVDGMEDGVVPADPAAYQVMRDQVRRLQRLASDIREAAAAQEHALELHPTVIGVDRLLNGAAAAAEARYRAAGIALHCDPDPACGTVRADPDRIGQVLGNLLDNALRHTPAGGQVVMDAAPGPRDTVVIEVADSGEGIPVDQLEAVFDRFHRVDPARAGRGGGSGLGLTIARAIVAEHGGTLTAHSAGPGGGATFRITLPATP
jgi:signal transduction histidine kinase